MVWFLIGNDAFLSRVTEFKLKEETSGNGKCPLRAGPESSNLVRKLEAPKPIDTGSKVAAKVDVKQVEDGKKNGHYTEKGHSLVSEEVVRTISSTR